MKYLFANLNFIIGDLVPKKHRVWKAYLSSRKLLFSILSQSMNNKIIDD